MRYYPIFVQLERKSCLVVGAGKVGRRKAQSLLDSGAEHITIIDTLPADENMTTLIAQKQVEFHCRNFQPSDIEGKFIVIACTSNKMVNDDISRLCNENDILCNIADQPCKGNFIVPASIKQGDLTVAISTAGCSPALAKCIRKDLQETFGGEYADLIKIMGRIRPILLELHFETKENTIIFRELVNSELLTALSDNNKTQVITILQDILPQILHANISEILDGLI